MKLNLDTLPAGRSALEVELAFRRDVETEPTDSFTLRGRLDVDNTSAHVLLSGEVVVRGRYDCDRCLEIFDLAYPAEVEILVQRGGPAAPEHESDIYEIRQAGGEVDLDDALREAAMIAWPLRTLCSEDCRGVCSQCGRNLNTGPCDCPQASADPRWDDLPT